MAYLLAVRLLDVPLGGGGGGDAPGGTAEPRGEKERGGEQQDMVCGRLPPLPGAPPAFTVDGHRDSIEAAGRSRGDGSRL